MAGSSGTRLAPDPPRGPRAALVIATTKYEDPELRQLRAPAHDAQALAEVLGDAAIGAFTVTRVIDADERQARRAIDVFLSGRSTGDVVVVYLSCHGVLDRRNRLYFAVADTLKSQLSSTGIPSAWLLDQLEDCRARQQVLILDCCFSGAFAHGSKGDADLDLERRLAGHGRGQAVLTASRAGEYSFEGEALPDAAVSGSVFTAGLVEGLRTGAADAGGDGYISVDEAYDYAYRYVKSSGASQTPQRWLSGGEGAIVLARSLAGIAIIPAPLPEDLAASLNSRYPAVRIGAVHELGDWLAGDDPARAITAEQKLRQIADTDNPTVAAAARAYLASRAEAAAPTGPDAQTVQGDENTAGTAAKKSAERVPSSQARAARLLAEAERIAQSITDPSWRVSVLRGVAAAVAAADPDRAARLLADAENIAQSITDPHKKALRLGDVAVTVAATDPDRAERIAQSITDLDEKVLTLHVVAAEMAATDPDRAARLLADAENIAQSTTDPDMKARRLGEVAAAVAATDPDRAERIARSITDKNKKELTLRGVAAAVAATDSDRAERIARSITTQSWKASALTKVAAAVVATHSDRAAQLIADAERIAQSITFQPLKDSVLEGIAPAVAASDSDRAERIAQSISDSGMKERALRDIAKAVAATDPDRAERIAQSISDSGMKERALRDIAKAVAATDSDRAERIAQSITDRGVRVWALSDIAETVAASDPDRAERIAQSITDRGIKAWLLVKIVNV